MTGEIFSSKFSSGLSEKKERTKQFICVIIGICIASILTGAAIGNRAEVVKAKTSQVQEELAKEVFRFHVLANSDSDVDQEVKLKVRDAVLSYMKESMDEGESAERTKAWAKEHLKELDETANAVLAENGFSYKAVSSVETCYFPEKRYGDITFPEGNYEALRIELGKAGGHNWWCVLYPNLCFIDSACAVVSEEGKEELESVLDEEEYEMITAAADFKIKWFFFGNDKKEK